MSLASVVLLFALSPARYAVLPVQAATDIWDGYGQLKWACSCESWGEPNKEPREFKDGKVLRGVPNPQDIGACQINIPFWGATAKKLGYNIYTLDGNVSMAKYILGQQGIKAWEWSQKCWDTK